ncbi:MAG: hypothetical protein JSR78_16185 [Proteobacteria bacterium]|nr:hypothetical protein [Pseudomonadota bacterium]
MRKLLSTPEGLATLTGAGILAAATNMNIMATGGYLTSHAALVVALSAGVFAGARVIGAGVAGRIAAVIILALACGELYNFAATGERVVTEREDGAAPLKDALAKHNAAIEKLKAVENGDVSTPRLTLAKQAKAQADADVAAEAGNGGCKSVCRMKQAQAEAAAAELRAAFADAQQARDGQIQEARAEVAASPLPASATPLADRLGWAPWVLDLAMAALLSIGSNGLAGVLIAFGAQRSPEVSVRSVPANDEGQSDYGMPSDFDAAKIHLMISGNSEVPGNPPTPPKGGRRRGRKADKKVVDFSEKFLARNGRAPSGGEIKAAFPELPTSTAYDYSQRARASA